MRTSGTGRKSNGQEKGHRKPWRKNRAEQDWDAPLFQILALADAIDQFMQLRCLDVGFGHGRSLV
jgi:hypothetical protein